MEYIYASMLLFSVKQPITEANVKKVLESVGVKPEEGRIKALVAALEGVNIEEAVKEAAVAPVAVAQVAASAQAPAAKQEKKEEKKSEEAAAAGLAGLFG